MVHVVTADETASACPGCGVLSTSVKGWACSRPRDLPYGEAGVRLVWRKRDIGPGCADHPVRLDGRRCATG